ncbi:MAG: hypothetical protein ACK2TZ_12225 [Anaerolineales bacterium]
MKQIQEAFPEVPNARWVALRLLDGDERIIRAVENGELGDLTYSQTIPEDVTVNKVSQKSGFAQ